jgi:hypothetical protein
LWWQAALGLYYVPIVHFQSVNNKPKPTAPAENIEMEVAEKKLALICAVAETAKYPVKMDGIIDLPEKTAVDVIIALSKALRGKRLVVFGGLFLDCQKVLKLDDVEEGDLIGVEGEEPINEVAQVLYKFHVKVGCYVC